MFGRKRTVSGLCRALRLPLTRGDPTPKSMRLIPLPRVFLAAVALAATTLGLHADPLRFTGSDLVGESLRTHLADAVAERDLQLQFSQRGSRLGLTALREGRADIGLLVLAPDDPKPGDTLSSAVMGYLTCIVAAPQSVSINQITFPQLAGVFGASEQQAYRRWSELGVLGDWAPRSISALAISRRQSLALDLFRHQVLKTPELKPNVAQLESVADIYARLRGEEGGIAILPEPPPAGSGLKVLLLAKGAQDVAYGPTPENLHTGDYPLRIPVLLVFPRGEGGRLRDVIRALLAEDTIPALQSSGIIPLPVQARNQLLFDLENR